LPSITGRVDPVPTSDARTSDHLTSAPEVPPPDVVVIGAGPVGENVADYARRGGLSVVVVERELVGGECSFWACIPSKALLRPVHAVTAARRLAGAAQAVTGPPDAAAVLGRRDSFVHGYDDGSQVGWLQGAGIELVRGTARLAGERRVVVATTDGEVHLEARRAVVVCTGSAASLPPVPGVGRRPAVDQPGGHGAEGGPAPARRDRRRRRLAGDGRRGQGPRRRAGHAAGPR
jgi:dihydrolipoamide dehydrogenase